MQGQDLIPEQKYDSVNGTATVHITDWLTFFVDGFGIDIEVFHPPLGSVKGRPDWLAKGRTAVGLPAAVVKA